MALSVNSWHAIRLSAHEGAPVASRSARPGPREGARNLTPWMLEGAYLDARNLTLQTHLGWLFLLEKS